MAPQHRGLKTWKRQVVNLENSIVKQITSSVILAMEAVKLSIAEQIFEKMEEAMRSKEELEVVNYQLERRIDQI